MTDSQIVKIDREIIVKLDKAIDESMSINSKENFEGRGHSTEVEAEADFTKMNNHLRLAGMCRYESNKLKEDMTFDAALDGFVINNSLRFFDSYEQIAMLCAGLSPLKVSKNFFNQSMTIKALQNLKKIDESSLLGLLFDLRMTDLNGILKTTKPLKRSFSMPRLSRFDRVTPYLGASLPHHTFQGCDPSDPIMRLLFDEEGKCSKHLIALTLSIYVHLSSRLDIAIELLPSCVEEFEDSPFREIPIAESLNQMIEWAAKHSLNTPHLKASLSEQNQITKKSSLIYNAGQDMVFEKENNNGEDRADKNSHMENPKSSPKLKLPEKRELVLRGWLMGRGYSIGDVVNETQEVVWNDLKKAEPKLFNYDAVKYTREGKSMAATPKTFFNNQQKVCKFR
jgi:hypothetical protein